MPTPAALGYRMPAEWEAHSATWLAWPHKEASWPGKLSSVQSVWVEVVQMLSVGETVEILVNEAAPAPLVRELLERAGTMMDRVRFHNVPTDDAWTRDSGPTFVTRQNGLNTELALVDWQYNAWGGKYPPWEADDRVSGRIGQLLGVPVFHPGIVLEGGSIEVNGSGTVLTTESCLLNPNRNPRLNREEIEAYLRAYLGVRQVLWLGEGIVGDDTDGHIDDLARFIAADTVVTVLEDDPEDENYALLRANHIRLQGMCDQNGRPLRIRTLPMPDPVEYEGTRLPASYANFYIANAVVLVPTFGGDKDAHVFDILRAAFPGRRVVGINASDLIWGLGAIHCITQQQPASSHDGRVRRREATKGADRERRGGGHG